jgi:HAD superfamily hydrolase (TIGR01509 family)
MSPRECGGRFALVAFDMDGVLVDTAACHARAYEELWQLVGMEGPAYAILAGRATRDVVSDVTAPLRPSAAQILRWTEFKQSAARRYLAATGTLFDDVIECVEAIARGGSRLALGTAASQATTTMLLDRTGLRRFFSLIVTADEVSAGKPSPEIYSRIMTAARVKPADCLVVEDSPSGIAAGISSGAFVISVRTGRRSDAAHFLGSFSDLRALLGWLGTSAS